MVKKFSEIDIVLVRPKKAENLGSIARLISNFGFNNLILVNPLVSPLDERALITARKAKEVLHNAVIVEKIVAATEKSNLIIGTTARIGGDYNLKRVAISPEILKLDELEGKISLIFGPEDDGLSNEEIEICDIIVTLSASEEWPSLNLSHAAAIVMYFIYQAQSEEPEKKHRPALQVERDILLNEFSELIGKLSFNKSKQATQAFKNIIGRNYISGRETHTLIGVFKEISKLIPSIDDDNLKKDMNLDLSLKKTSN